MFLDVDDLWPDNNLHMLVNEMISEPDMDVIQGYAQVMKYNFEINDYEYIGKPKESFPYSIAAAIYRKSVFAKVGLFDRLMFGEDMDWFYRAIELKAKIKRLEDVTLIVRRHDKNMTRGKSVVERNMLRVVKKHLDRVRVQEIRSEVLNKSLETRGRTDQITTPLVNVIIPAYNAQAFLSEAIQSVREQNYNPLEIIVVDDGSTDRTAEIIARKGDSIRYFYQRNSGAAAARNKGLAMAHGEIIAFLDSDDLWPPDKLHTQITWLANNPKIDVVMGRVQYVGLFTARESKIPFESSDKTLVNSYLGCCVFRREVFDKVGTFDETLRYSEDHDWFLRAREQGVSINIIEKVTLYYRLHEQNMTRNKNMNGFQLAKVLKKSLDRRRSQNNGHVQLLPKLSDFDEAKTSIRNDLKQKETG
jgi:GT2 family glycosyltransferase